MTEKTFTLSQLREALNRNFCTYCKMSHRNCRGDSCEVRFVMNTLESILLEDEYLDLREVIT
jgi:hypothetical protein